MQAYQLKKYPATIREEFSEKQTVYSAPAGRKINPQ
jgi:hypothetical protein